MKVSAAIGALNALAQETRLAIFRILVQRGPDGIAAGEIARRLHLPLPTLSFHLTQLRFAGLITARRTGRSIFYAAEYAAMNRLLAYLTQNCCAEGQGTCAPVVRCARENRIQAAGDPRRVAKGARS